MRNYLIILALTGVTLSVSSCRKGCTDPVAENYDARAKKNDNTCTYVEEVTTTEVQLAITHMAGTASFAFNTDYTDDFGNKYQFTRAEMYLSNPVYMNEDMNMISSPSEYALVSPVATSYAFGTVPADEHVHMMDINIGVDSTTNYSTEPGDYATDHPLAYHNPTTYWSWNSGYLFIMLEGVVDIDGNGTFDAGENFVLHIGTNSMLRTKAGLMAHFNPVAGQTHNIALDVNWSGFLTGIDLSIDNITHTDASHLPLAKAVADNAASVLSIHM